MKNDYHLFRRTTPQWLRFLITGAVAVALMLIDGQNERLSFVRTAADTLTSPLKNTGSRELAGRRIQSLIPITNIGIREPKTQSRTRRTSRKIKRINPRAKRAP
jgi:hypothetical protein